MRSNARRDAHAGRSHGGKGHHETGQGEKKEEGARSSRTRDAAARRAAFRGLGICSTNHRAGGQATELLSGRSGRAGLLQGAGPAIPDADERGIESLHDSPQRGRQQMTAVVAPPPQPEAVEKKVEKGAGLLHEYITRNLTPQQIEQERRAQLARIGALRQSAVLTYAARLTAMPVQAPTPILYDDLLPFTDMLANCTGDRIAIVLETHGGVGEVGREMDRKSTRLNSSHGYISYAVFCLKKKNTSS